MDLLKIIPSATGHQGIVSMVVFGALRYPDEILVWDDLLLNTLY